uniref:Uncharacterized protein n=1 Tax=viral metagenome TaxID=1070528 RepID=A0A6H1ZHB2_9ZZZZ
MRKDLAAELSDLPFEIIRNGVVVAAVDYPTVEMIPFRVTANRPVRQVVGGGDEGVINPAVAFFNPMPKKGGR